MVLKYIEHVLESGWVKPFSIPNYPTKTCVLASTAFAIQACGLYDFGSNSGLLAGLTLLAVNLRLFCQTMDPYERFESLTCQVFFGRVNILDDKASKKVIFLKTFDWQWLCYTLKNTDDTDLIWNLFFETKRVSYFRHLCPPKHRTEPKESCQKYTLAHLADFKWF